MIRLALVGFGGYGWSLVQAINQARDAVGCRLIAAADARLSALPEKAEALSRAGVELFSDPLAMFEALRGKCDAAYIATGIPSHAPLTIAAARAGLHVHLEKPPAATVQEVDAMLAALDAAGRFCLVGFQALHGDDIRFVKSRVASGRLGRVRSLVCHAGWPRNQAYYTRNDWAGKLRVESAVYGDPAHRAWVLDGPATNALAHQITNMLFLASPEANRLATPVSVRAELYTAGPVESHDTCAIEIHTAEGPTSLFLASHCSDANFGPVIEIEAERGHVRWTMRDGARVCYSDGPEETCPADNGAAKMIANFAEAVRANDRSLLRCDLAETRKFVLALDGAHESSGRIHRIAADHVRRVGEGGEMRTVVEGLDAALR
ncbi:MAG TPA: Gfo/Idh/MocA family oxidoreductase, partial [Planctomycetota bacterium]|nr:Gfo/Idh/MocA family oxidoreductase [Planctomycetota bacterium]